MLFQNTYQSRSILCLVFCFLSIFYYAEDREDIVYLKKGVEIINSQYIYTSLQKQPKSQNLYVKEGVILHNKALIHATIVYYSTLISEEVRKNEREIFKTTLLKSNSKPIRLKYTMKLLNSSRTMEGVIEHSCLLLNCATTTSVYYDKFLSSIYLKTLSKKYFEQKNSIRPNFIECCFNTHFVTHNSPRPPPILL